MCILCTHVSAVWKSTNEAKLTITSDSNVSEYRLVRQVAQLTSFYLIGLSLYRLKKIGTYRNQ